MTGLVGYRGAVNATSEAQERKYASYLLADELRQSSDDLTRLARTYVVTGDPSYKKQYMDIVDIRDGKKARPADYHRIYWDFVAGGEASPRPAGRQAPLLTLMQEAGFTQDEFAKLDEAKARSDALIGLETEAMNLVEGKDKAGKPLAAPDPARARDLVHSRDYHVYKARIMRPIDEFFVKLEQRTQGAVEAAEFRRSLYAALAFVGAAFLVLSVVALCVFVSSRVLKGLDGLRTAMGEIIGGNLDVAVAGAGRPDEIGEMAGALQTFRDNAVRMKELEADERTAAGERVRRAEAMAAVVEEVSVVVEAAVNGDFSARARVNGGEAALTKLVEGINEINAVVDSATTEFAAVLAALAQGDLTGQVTTDYRGRFGELKTAVNETITRLAEMVATIQTTAVDVSSTAREISGGARDLSQRTEDQASSLEETAATTEELTASVKASAQASHEAASLAQEAMQVAENGGAIVNDAIAAMARIEQASQKISDITSMIDEIAFQTNLLALNAAVEAARAGDAGNGFAVVAAEVRTLAQRSGDAAKGITQLISSSAAEVAAGVRLVREAGDALGRIVEASRKVARTVSEISSASSEQANGIDEMSQVVAQMDQMTQQNAALAEESAAAATALTDRIRELNDLVTAFRIRQNVTSGARGPAGTNLPAHLQSLARKAFADRTPPANDASDRRLQAMTAPAERPARRAAAGRGDSGWAEF
ncbi:methyl-accepting chemotaxis protein [Chelatococcus sp. SYSU_G07232]|uniref:Methyl-accepting chemotaxis protein n=1 Tax=Chelatococcus albus TaxID=3047466 RepID=A0ABT7AFG2_9HYPH|nr:methyl-accepting chemotaxis protein [Chelatococcus sp. SYSU_G07232]MDJ1157747.1 methyl-accepting chemotaxis protein [Chelatococcus sp. SYSU_G07232]